MFSLSKNQIQRLATPNSYERGEEYYHRGTILHPTRRGNLLSGYCTGTALYEMTIAFDGNAIANFHCSCPYDRGGLCKHCVALLLTWCRESELFREVPTLRETLAERSKSELLDLVEAMVATEPMLLSLIPASLSPTTHSPLPTPSLDFPTSRAIAEALQPRVDAAKRYFEAGDVFNAGRLYYSLLSELTRSYDEERESLDYNGELCALSSVLVAGLRECLTSSEIPEALQRLWIGALIEAYGRNLEGGEYADGIDAVLLAIDSERLMEVVAGLDRQMKRAILKLLEQKQKQKSLPETREFDEVFPEYRERAEKYIKQRNRRSYRQAIKFLREAKSSCTTEQHLSDWHDYIAELRSRYGNLKALWEEMEKATF
ncbi:MAG: hypothetical protein AAGA60_27125 [Cyanobacteria bacterium P01_E01_bin.42]